MSQLDHTWRMQSLCRLLRLVLAAIEEVAIKSEIDCMPRADRDTRLGRDVAGQIEALAKNVTQFKLGAT